VFNEVHGQLLGLTSQKKTKEKKGLEFVSRKVTLILSLFQGTVLLWLTAMIPQAKPPSCNQLKGSCKSATTAQMALLVSSFAVLSIGAGGVLPCSLSFGGDQLAKDDNPRNARVLRSFFGWYYASQAISIMLAMTIIVPIQDHFGWKVGFGIPVILMFISAVTFFLASPFYVKQKAKKSLFTGFAQVIAVAYKNRKLAILNKSSSEMYHRGKNSCLIAPTEKLR